MTRWTEQDLQTLKAKSRVIVHKQDVHASEPRSNTGTDPRIAPSIAESHFPPGKDPFDAPKSRQIALRGAKAAALRGSWAKTLQAQCRASGMLIPALEYRFHEERKWRFDCAFLVPQTLQRVAVEIEGGIWTRGRHTRGNGYLNDMAKYNEATRLGWRIFRFTPNQVKTGVALEYLKKILA